MIKIVIFYTLGLLLNLDLFNWKFYIFHLYSISALLSYYGNSKIRYYNIYLLYACALLLSFLTAVCLPILWKTPRNFETRIMYKIFTFFVNAPLKIKWIKKNTQVLKKNEGAVIVANHQCTFDVLGLSQLDEIQRVSPVVKKSLLFWPVFGFFSYITGCLFVDRSNPASAKETLKTARDYVVRYKRILYMYPEGTRNNTGTLLPFKKGAFRTAIEAQAPIIPLVMSPFYFIDNRKKTFDGGEVILSVLEPIPTTGLTPEDTEKLMGITYDRMSSEYEKLKKLEH